MIRNCLGRAVDSTCFAVVTKLCDTCIDWMIDLKRHIGYHATKSKQRTHLWMYNRTMPAQFSEACFQRKGHMQHIAIANRMLYSTCMTKTANVIRQLDDYFT